MVHDHASLLSRSITVKSRGEASHASRRTPASSPHGPSKANDEVNAGCPYLPKGLNASAGRLGWPWYARSQLEDAPTSSSEGREALAVKAKAQVCILHNFQTWVEAQATPSAWSPAPWCGQHLVPPGEHRLVSEQDPEAPGRGGEGRERGDWPVGRSDAGRSDSGDGSVHHDECSGMSRAPTRLLPDEGAGTKQQRQVIGFRRIMERHQPQRLGAAVSSMRSS